MSWRDHLLIWGMYLLIAQQVIQIMTVMVALTALISLDFMAPAVNLVFAASWWLDLFGFLMVGVGFHALGRFFSDDDDLKTQSRTIGILLAFWTVPMFMFRASLRVLTSQKDYWTLLSLGLNLWDFNASGTPTAVIKDGIYMLWVLATWWPILLIIHGITGLGLVAIPFFLETATRTQNVSIPLGRLNMTHLKLLFASAATANLIFFTLAIIAFQPLIPLITSLNAQLTSVTDEPTIKQAAMTLQGLNLSLFLVILGGKQLLSAGVALFAWNYGLRPIASLQKQARELHETKKKERDSGTNDEKKQPEEQKAS